MKTEKIDSVLKKLVLDLEQSRDNRPGSREKNGKAPVSKKIADETQVVFEPLRSGDIETIWPRIIGEDFRAHSYVDRVHKDKLLVRIDSSCYLTAFNMKKQEILSKIHKAGFLHIKQIEFRI